jgi:hypothetical protein
MKPMLDFVASLDAPWRFGTDNPASLLAPLGWTVDARDLSEVGTELGRWSFPLAPRNLPGAPRSFLVQATKSSR